MRKILLTAILLFSTNLFSQSLESKIGQMMMVGFREDFGFKDTLIYDIANRNLGGVILFGYNLDNPVQITNLTSELKSYASVPLMISTDQEGGVVARLKESNGFRSTYSAYQLGTVFNSEDSTRAQAAMMAGWLSQSGINVNLAPVVDVNVDPQSPAIGNLNRSFSSDPQLVYQHASWFIDEFHNENIITTLKHYPGHGSAQTDSHLGFTDITQTWADSELIPYSKLFADGFEDMVMTGHLYYGNWDTTYPASLFEYAISTMLRDSLGFNGVVISDEMFMQAISNNFGFDEAVVQAVNAGTDILLFRTNEYEGSSIVDHVIRLLSEKVGDGTVAQSTIDSAYNRITALKNEWLATGVEQWAYQRYIPHDYKIANYPNPFNPETKIVVSIAKAGRHKIKIFNTLGEQVEVIADNNFNPGRYEFSFDGSRLASGVYLLVIENNSTIYTHKMMLLK